MLQPVALEQLLTVVVICATNTDDVQMKVKENNNTMMRYSVPLPKSNSPLPVYLFNVELRSVLMKTSSGFLHITSTHPSFFLKLQCGCAEEIVLEKDTSVVIPVLWSLHPNVYSNVETAVHVLLTYVVSRIATAAFSRI